MLYPGSVVPLAMFKVRFLGNDLAKSLLLDQALFEESSEIFSDLKRETVSRWSGKKCLWSQVLTKAQLIPQTKKFSTIRWKTYFQSQDFRDKVYLQLFSELTLSSLVLIFSSLVLIFLDGSSSLVAACCSVKTSCWKMPLFCNNPSSSILPCREHCWKNHISRHFLSLSLHFLILFPFSHSPFLYFLSIFSFSCHFLSLSLHFLIFSPFSHSLAIFSISISLFLSDPGIPGPIYGSKPLSQTN